MSSQHAQRPGRNRRGITGGWHALTWWNLAWLMMLFFAPLFDPAGAGFGWAIGGLLLVVFVPLYLAIEHRPGPLRRWGPHLTAALGLAAVPFNAGAAVLLVYAAAFAGSYMPRRDATRWLVA